VLDEDELVLELLELLVDEGLDELDELDEDELLLELLELLLDDELEELDELDEDELLLELPLAPKHENCQAPLTQAPPVPEKANPFAGLKDLVSGPSKGKNTL